MKCFWFTWLFGYLLFAGTGCAEPGAGPRSMTVTLDSWQHSVERYVRDEGNGDPNILRDTTLPNSQRGFAVIGGPAVDRATDASGVLLGYRVIDGRPWFVYLVAVIQEGVVEDIRLTGLSWTPHRIDWTVSPPDAQMVQRYRSLQTDESYDLFPAAADRFELSIAGDQATVVNARSGATWQLYFATIPKPEP